MLGLGCLAHLQEPSESEPDEEGRVEWIEGKGDEVGAGRRLVERGGACGKVGREWDWRSLRVCEWGKVLSGAEPRGRAGWRPHLVHKALRIEQRSTGDGVHLQRVASVGKQKLRVG